MFSYYLWYILVQNRYILSTYSLRTFCQHAHIENIKTVANLTNNKDVFMCILCFHARAGYLQTYETLLKELKEHPGSAHVEEDSTYSVHTKYILVHTSCILSMY